MKNMYNEREVDTLWIDEKPRYSFDDLSPILSEPGREFYREQFPTSVEYLIRGLDRSYAQEHQIVPPDISEFANLFNLWIEFIRNSADRCSGLETYPNESEIMEFVQLAQTLGYFEDRFVLVGPFELNAHERLDISWASEPRGSHPIGNDSMPSLQLSGLGVRPVFMDGESLKLLPCVKTKGREDSLKVSPVARKFMRLLEGSLSFMALQSDQEDNEHVYQEDFLEKIFEFLQEQHVFTLSDSSLQQYGPYLPNWLMSVQNDGYTPKRVEHRLHYDPFLGSYGADYFMRHDNLGIGANGAQRFIQQTLSMRTGRTLIGFVSTGIDFQVNRVLRERFLSEPRT